MARAAEPLLAFERASSRLLDRADAAGLELHGVLWLPDGARLAEDLRTLPFVRFLDKMRAAGVLSAAGRRLSGLPLSAAAWERLLQDPALLIWARTPSTTATTETTASESEEVSGTTEADAAGDRTPASRTESERAAAIAAAVAKAAAAREEMAETPATKAAKDKVAANETRASPSPQPVLLIPFEPDTAAGLTTMRWLVSSGYAEAKRRTPDLQVERRQIAGTTLHAWVRPERQPPTNQAERTNGRNERNETPPTDWTEGTDRVVLAFFLQDDTLALSSDAPLLGRLLSSRATVPAAANEATPNAAATTPSPGPSAAVAAAPSEFAVKARNTIAEARAHRAPVAGVFDARAFPILRSAGWIAEGLGIQPLGAVAERLAETAEENGDTDRHGQTRTDTDPGRAAAPLKLAPGTAAATAAAPPETAAANTAAPNSAAREKPARPPVGRGLADLESVEILYWPDATLPRSRIRLEFREQARNWMELSSGHRAFAAPDFAPASCVGFWAMRLPKPLAGEDAAEGGVEIARLYIPTRFRLTGVWLVEAPRLTAWLRRQMTRADGYLTSATLEMPSGDEPPTSTWAHVRRSLGDLEPWMPLLGVSWKVRVLSDHLAFSSSRLALNELVSVGRGGTDSLRAAQPELFGQDAATAPDESRTHPRPAFDPAAPSAPDAPPTPLDSPLGRSLGPSHAAFERYADIARRAQSVRALDIVSFPFLSDPDDDAKFFQINYLALAQKVPGARGWLATLPPHHSRVLWYPEAAVLEVATQSASGLPGDPRVWGALGVSLIPSLDPRDAAWLEWLGGYFSFSLPGLPSLPGFPGFSGGGDDEAATGLLPTWLERLDPRNWGTDERPSDGDAPAETESPPDTDETESEDE